MVPSLCEGKDMAPRVAVRLKSLFLACSALLSDLGSYVGVRPDRLGLLASSKPHIGLSQLRYNLFRGVAFSRHDVLLQAQNSQKL